MTLRLPRALLVLFGLFSLGCTISKPIARQALDFNLAFEKAKNQQILLNVVRSSLHLPTHYTALSQLLGTANGTFSPTLSIPTGGAASDLYGLTLTGSGTSGVSTVSMATLDSQTFVQGIMSPLSIDNLDYYEKQGWSQELILLLFVRKLMIDGEEYINQPTSDFKELERFLARIRTLDFKVKSEAGGAVGPAFALGPNESLAGLILQGKSAGLELVEVKASGDGGKTEKKYQFRSVAGGKTLFLDESKTLSAHATHEESEEKNTIFFRSTDGIFTYLGEILRHQDASDPKPKVRVQKEDGSGEKEVVLFLAERARKGNRTDARVKVSLRGAKYVIPGESGSFEHRSMEVLAILSQLISLHKSSTEIPSTGVVTVSGG